MTIKQKLKKLYTDYKLTIVILAGLMAFRSTVLDWYHIPSSSMEPTLNIGDQVVVDKMAYDTRFPLTTISMIKRDNPKAGDVIVFDIEGITMVKRILGVPGDTIEVINDFTYINGTKTSYEVVDEDDTATFYRQYINGKENIIKQLKTGSSQLARVKPITVPNDHFFVVGDNRRGSVDSRYFGFIPRNSIKGRANKILARFDYYLFGLLPASIPDTEHIWKDI